MLKERADFVTQGDHGVGVIELVDKLVNSDLVELEPLLTRHELPLGAREDGQEVRLKPYGANVLLTGTSGSGKSTFATSFLERLIEHGYQFCIVDPEGDYQNLEGAAILGDPKRAPLVDEVCNLLEKSEQNVVVNLLGLALENRPSFFKELLPALLKLRLQTGRPHWIVIDEAHHLLPPDWAPVSDTLPQELSGLMLITVHPDQVTPMLLASVNVVITIGETPEQTLHTFSEVIKQAPPEVPAVKLQPGEAIAWYREPESHPFWFRGIPPQTEHQRHIRKYAEGEMSDQDVFYFRGPEGKLKLRAQNLMVFLQSIHDEELAKEAEKIEKMRDILPEESRALIKTKIEERYTSPA
jgi:hypothetical protein